MEARHLLCRHLALLLTLGTSFNIANSAAAARYQDDVSVSKIIYSEFNS